MLRINSDQNIRPTLIFAYLFALFAAVYANAMDYRHMLRLKPLDACFRMVLATEGVSDTGTFIVAPFFSADPRKRVPMSDVILSKALESIVNELAASLSADSAIVNGPDRNRPAQYRLQGSV